MPGDTIDWSTYLQTALSLILVIGMILVVTWAMRRYGFAQLAPKNRGRKMKRRLSVVETANLDARRRLVLVRYDNQEHLLLVGGTTDLVIGDPIAAPDQDNSDLLEDTPIETLVEKEAQP